MILNFEHGEHMRKLILQSVTQAQAGKNPGLIAGGK